MEEFLDNVIKMLVWFSNDWKTIALTHLEYLIPATLFLALALYWHETGRFPIIGFVVRILWLPINLLFAVFWIMGLFISLILDILDFFKHAKSIILVFVLILSLEDAKFYLLLAGLFILFWQGVDTQRLWQRMNYYPTAKRRPERQEPRAKAEKPKPAPKLPQRKELAPAPPPRVSIVATARGRVHRHKELIPKLPLHLQALLVADKPPARQSWLVSSIKQGARLLLWLLLLPVKWLRKPKKRKAQETPAEDIPAENIATSEASNE